MKQEFGFFIQPDSHSFPNTFPFYPSSSGLHFNPNLLFWAYGNRHVAKTFCFFVSALLLLQRASRHTRTHTHTYLKIKPDATSSNSTCLIFDKTKWFRLTSVPLRITYRQRGVSVGRLSFRKLSAVSGTQSARRTHRKYKFKMSGRGQVASRAGPSSRAGTPRAHGGVWMRKCTEINTRFM